jgi:hypothetical protein
MLVSEATETGQWIVMYDKTWFISVHLLVRYVSVIIYFVYLFIVFFKYRVDVFSKNVFFLNCNTYVHTYIHTMWWKCIWQNFDIVSKIVIVDIMI